MGHDPGEPIKDIGKEVRELRRPVEHIGRILVIITPKVETEKMLVHPVVHCHFDLVAHAGVNVLRDAVPGRPDNTKSRRNDDIQHRTITGAAVPGVRLGKCGRRQSREIRSDDRQHRAEYRTYKLDKYRDRCGFIRNDGDTPNGLCILTPSQLVRFCFTRTRHILLSIQT